MKKKAVKKRTGLKVSGEETVNREDRPDAAGQVLKPSDLGGFYR